MAIAKTESGQLQQELRFRNRIIGLLGGLLLLLGVALWRLPTQLSVYVPPDLSRPQLVKPGEIPPSYV
ncbi:MAG: TIGR03746 family integrating conjugative element protein, partial [Candidatus Contendobacter sp.]|nr:TIGR03746 family integrating conjugative element protein [Candidatus Contendobacter sp.]